MQHNDDFDFQGGNQPQIEQDQKDIKIQELNDDDDPVFMILLEESNITDLEYAILLDDLLFFKREARLYNYIAYLFQLTEIDKQNAPEHIGQLTKLLKLLFQIHEIGQHSEYTQIIEQQHPFGLFINSDLSMIDLLKNIILNQEINKKKDDIFFQIRIYLPRFLIFSINPPKPFVSKNQMKSLQNQIISKINNQVFETNNVTPCQLDLLAFSYISDSKLNDQLYNEIIFLLKSTLDSLLEANSAEQGYNQKIKNLLEFFLVFTTNEKILQSFHQITFHTTLYNSIKNSFSAYGIDNQPSWFQDPLIIDYMVNLITRILSSYQDNQQFTDILYEDFINCLKHKELDLITKVIIPILNSQQAPLVLVCFHPKVSVQERKLQSELFLENYSKMMEDSLIEQNVQSLEKNYYKKLNYYYSQLRMQPIHFIPKTETLTQLRQLYDENINITNLREGSINDIEVINPVTKILYLNSNYQKSLLVSFGKSMGGFLRLFDEIKLYLGEDNVEVKELLNELQIFCQIEEFQEDIVQLEEFQKYLISLVEMNKNKDITEIYEKLNSMIYQKLDQFFKEKPYLKFIAILKYRIFEQIVITAEKQLNYINKNQRMDSGNPKDVGNGKDQQFQQFKQNQNYKKAKFENILNCILQLLDQPVSIKILQRIQSSDVIKFVIKYLQSINLTSSKSQKTLGQIVKLIYCLAQSEMTLKLFISNENICLFRQMESFNNKLIMRLQAGSYILNTHKEFMQLYQYVEASLYAARLINIKFLDLDHKHKEDAKLSKLQLYSTFMKILAVGKCEIKTDAKYLSNMKEYYQQTKSRSEYKIQKFLNQISTIEQNIPIQATNSIFIRHDNARMDCMRIVIFGGSGTPYAHGAFLYDLYFGNDYPVRPPKIKLATPRHDKVGFNPNLYNFRRVWLDLLGTWDDSWNVDYSTILEKLFSVKSLVMSENFMINKPESQMETLNVGQANRGYCNFIKINNIRYAMIEQLQNPPRGFEEVIKKGFYLRKELIMKEIELWIEQADLPATYNQIQNEQTYNLQPSFYKQDLIKIYEELKVELEKLKFDIETDFQVNQRKKEISLNFETPYSQQEQKTKKQMLMPQGLNINEIDVNYNENVQQRQFDLNDKNLQNLMSRYIAVVGLDAVKKQSESTIFIHTLNGLGIEIAKNLILSGVKRLILFDSELAQMSDLGSNFYLTEQDLKKRRDLSVLNKLRHLNPYVQIDVLQNSLDELNLDEIQVFVTQDPDIASKVSTNNKLAVILAQTRNIFARIVTDFGDEFIVEDKDGEQSSEVNIENISNNVVTLFKNQNHNLSENDLVIIKEVNQEQGIGESYNQVFKIKNVKTQSFELETNRVFNKYVSHGIAYQQKQPIRLQFDRIQKAISSFNHYCDNVGIFDGIDLIKRDIIHFCLNTIAKDQLTHNWDIEKIKMFITSMRLSDLNQKLYFKYNECVLTKYQEELLPLFTLLSMNTQFQPLCALVGGMAAQEVLKAINKKYSPIHQVYVQSFEDVLPFKLTEFNFVQVSQPNNLEINLKKYEECMSKLGFQQNQNTRYTDLANTIGNINQIFNADVFVVGAGAIGCELLKNFAMLGVSKNGKIYVTDPDIIKNSNLGRQFLFREKHIRKPKSVTAAAVVKYMNPDINIVARQDKVCPETQDIYHTNFYNQMKCMTTALDNVQTRLFMDSKCIENGVPLIESGTFGSKGHVQSIIPYIQTERYVKKQDPEEINDIPYCTLKMFPESNIHCLEWARDKFEQYFFRKPQALFQLIQDPSPLQQTVEMAIKVLNKYPTSFQECVIMGRLKFQKLFNQDIITLTSAFPLNSVTEEGQPFWAPPKRSPQPIEFGEKFAFEFVEDFAILTAQIYNIAIPNQYDLNLILQNVQIHKMDIKQNKIQQIIEIQDKNNQLQKQIVIEVKNYDQLIQEAKSLLNKVQPKLPQPQKFEKDNDTNHHVSFIKNATNARAINYGIQRVDWMWTKLKAGRIIPAMATTTSCIAALQTLELIKILQKSTQYRNTFLNAAIPFMMQSQPGKAQEFKLNNGLSISIWKKLNLNIKKLTEPLQYIVYEIEKMVGEEIINLQQRGKLFYMKKMIPKDEIKRYEYINSPINNCIEFIDGLSQINVQISNNISFLVLITLV
ncbi:unnamed protein product (macronuclear) [Paramecium tetraurelia]|uniref:UBC core domain-containing protein n=1 Tax=Paramecium tetraurelia TaxID=5888 RepID=A0C2Y2_PARTE|nr:uncharacterized protein GSPATT00034627001 [Paramecium tetraurelia]CAK65149.1 unnamed protein product [Paramecium tetraurelia]|eukprot:XP_001432546.1 hypothetical protein (macronuclear) [Paramecium tetraurelia strain d4-2]